MITDICQLYNIIDYFLLQFSLQQFFFFYS